MSIGATPYDDLEDPPIPGAPVPQPSYIDQVIAQPLPPGASTGAFPEEWPPPVPPEAPGMVPPPESIPPAPIPAAAPPPPPTVPGTVEDLTAKQQESIAAQTAEKAGEAPLAHDELALREQRRNDAIDHLAEMQAQKDRYDAAELAAQKHIDEAQSALKAFRFRDLAADQSSAAKIGSALAVAMGAFGSSLTHTPNYALQILDKQLDDDHARQVEQLNQLTNEELMARTGLKDVQQARLAASSALDVKDAAKDKLIARELDVAAARNTDANAANALRAYSAKLQEDAAEKQIKVRTLLADAQLKATHLAAENEALAARAAAARRKGGGGGGRAAAMSDFIAAAGALEKGKPIPGELAALALKAGLKPNQIATEVDKYRGSGAKAGAAEDKAGKAVDMFVRTRLNDDKQLAADLKERQEVGKALGLAKPGPDGNVNGVNFQQAVDATVKAATGLGARPGSITVFQNSLGGLYDKAMRNIQHGLTGQYTPHDVQVLNEALQKQRSYIAGNLRDKEATFSEEFANHPTTKDHADAWKAELKARFAGGGGGSSTKAPPGSKPGKLADGTRAWRYPDGTVHLDDGSLVK